jgi:hypothetical protein
MQDDTDSYASAGQAWQSLALTYKSVKKLGDDDLVAIITASEGIASLIKARDDRTSDVLFVSDATESLLQASSQVFVGITQLAKALDMSLDVTPAHVSLS